MSRYIGFAFEVYYPAGGWDDMVAHGDDLEAVKQQTLDAKVGTSPARGTFLHIVDTETMSRILEYKRVDSTDVWTWVECNNPPSNCWS